jgi:hypothetical protein
MKPDTTEQIANLLGGGALSVAVIAILVALFVWWAMWLLFPIVAYYQLRAANRTLRQLHGDLVELNARMSERSDRG